MSTPADSDRAALVRDAARMRLAMATARAAEAEQDAAVHAEAARRRQATIEELVRLRAAAGRLDILVAANRQDTLATAEKLARATGRPLARWRHRRRIRRLDAHLRRLANERAGLLARLDDIAERQRQARAELTRPEPRPRLGPRQIATRRAELDQATGTYRQARDRALPSPGAASAAQTTTTEITREVADRMADQLTGYLIGPAKDRANWTRRTGTNGEPFWTTGRGHDRWWAVHAPDPARHLTAAPDGVDAGFLTALGQAVAAVAAAEQRPTAAVITDILTTTTTTGTRQIRAAADAAAPAGGAALAGRWQAHTARSRAPRVIARPARDQRLDAAIAEVFTRAYRHAWEQQLHTLLVAEGAAALTRLAKEGDPPPPPLPRDRDQATRLYDQITAGSAENYLIRHGWRPLDQSATVRRWHNGLDAIVEVPTISSGADRQAVLRATAYTLAGQEQREAGEVLVELTDPPLRDPHLARVHSLLTNPPAAPDPQVTARLAARVSTPGGEVPLADLAGQQVETLGATDVVWKVATAAGEADAVARVAQLFGTTALDPTPPWPVPLFAAGPADQAEQVAARIWAAGTGLPPAQHARWFAHTWWPYHLTGTTRTLAVFLAGSLGHQPPAVAATRGGPGRDLFTATDRAALPERSSHDRFVATYRIVDAAARPRAVQAAAEALRDHLTGADLPVDEAALSAAAVHAGDPRRLAAPASAATLLAALTAVLPAGTDQQPPPAAGRPRRPPWPPPWKALAGARRPSTPGGTPLVVDPTSHLQRQLVTTAAGAVQTGLVPTPPPTRAAPTTRRAR
jgi:hypothetical protein